MVLKNEDSEQLAEKQKIILQLLIERTYRQNELQKALKISAPSLSYHLERLADDHLIEKKTITQIGNAKLNEISLQPSALQRVRSLLGKSSSQYTLITGFGFQEEGYRIPDISSRLLLKEGYKITRIVGFTNPEAREKREKQNSSEKLCSIDRYCVYPYQDYRYTTSPFFVQVENILQEEQRTSDLLIDLTPLSKLFTFKLLSIANKYHLPCFYLGLDENNNEFVIWMTQIHIEGISKDFKTG